MLQIQIQRISLSPASELEEEDMFLNRGAVRAGCGFLTGIAPLDVEGQVVIHPAPGGARYLVGLIDGEPGEPDTWLFLVTGAQAIEITKAGRIIPVDPGAWYLVQVPWRWWEQGEDE